MTSHRCGRCVCINHSPRDLCLLPHGRTEEIPLPPSWAWGVPGSFTKPRKHNCCESQGSSSPVLRDNQAGKAISAESVRVLDGYLLPGSRAEAGRGAFSPWGGSTISPPLSWIHEYHFCLKELWSIQRRVLPWGATW